MGFFEDELGSLADADARRFAGGSFAEDRLGPVVGAVRRRRAVRAAGVGGASVLSVGVLAVGGVNLPRVSASLGFALSDAAAVVCTTTTPVADAPWIALEQGSSATGATPLNHELADGALVGNYVWPKVTLEDRGSGTTTAIDIRNSVELTVNGLTSELTPRSDGTYTAMETSGGDVVNLRITPVEQPDLIFPFYPPTVEVQVASHEPAVATCVTSTPEPSDSPSWPPTSSTTPSSTPTPESTPSARSSSASRTELELPRTDTSPSVETAYNILDTELFMDHPTEWGEAYKDGETLVVNTVTRDVNEAAAVLADLGITGGVTLREVDLSIADYDTAMHALNESDYLSQVVAWVAPDYKELRLQVTVVPEADMGRVDRELASGLAEFDIPYVVDTGERPSFD
jgi:hypothetical protein